MEKNFKKNQLKAGYVVKLNNEDYAVIWPYKDGMELITAGDDTYSLNKYDDNLLFNGEPSNSLTIQIVFGLRNNSNRIYEISGEDRDVLFRRNSKKKLSKEDIEKLLGYEIDIVKEKQLKTVDDLVFEKIQKIY